MDMNKIVEHYIKLSQNLREDKVTVEELNEIMARDQQAYLSMFNRNLLQRNEYESILVLLNEFEDLFVEIIERRLAKLN